MCTNFLVQQRLAYIDKVIERLLCKAVDWIGDKLETDRLKNNT